MTILQNKSFLEEKNCFVIEICLLDGSMLEGSYLVLNDWMMDALSVISLEPGSSSEVTGLQADAGNRGLPARTWEATWCLAASRTLETSGWAILQAGLDVEPASEPG